MKTYLMKLNNMQRRLLKEATDKINLNFDVDINGNESWIRLETSFYSKGELKFKIEGPYGPMSDGTTTASGTPEELQVFVIAIINKLNEVNRILQTLKNA
jgi:hypothetical protein